jgi:hypothetical protein
MTMIKDRGHRATTESALLSEDIHSRAILRLCRKKGFQVKKEITIKDLIGSVKYAYTKTGLLTKMKADGGWIVHPRTGKVVGVAENKDQKANANACERVFKYLALVGDNKVFSLNRQIFVSFTGDAFVKGAGGQGLATLELADFAGISYTVNATQNELEQAIENWLDFLMGIE